ncbi:MAG: trypsin-like serine protease [Sporichthyaceae bacterium]
MQVSAILIGVSVSGLAGLSQASGALQASADGCRVDDGRALAEFAERDNTTEIFQHERWLLSDGAQENKRSVDAAIAQRFGDNTKSELHRTLAAGLIGVGPDHRAQQLVVLVDPKKVNVAELQTELRTRASNASRSRPENGPPIGIRVQAGCHGSDELIKADQIIAERAWHPRAGTTALFSMVDATTSTVKVSFNMSDREAAEALQATLGPVVTVELNGGGVRDKIRTNDTWSSSVGHWGGAEITNGNVACTSGFAVDTPTAGKAFVTAGHCFDNGEAISSGSSSYGTAQGEYDFPVYDMILLNGNINYDDDIYHTTDPNANETSPIDVTGHANGSAGEGVCISGQNTGRRCGATIVDPSGGRVCDSARCTSGLVVIQKIGDQICQPGDSGAPYYRRNSDDTQASIRGLHVGRPTGYTFSGQTCAGERPSSVESHLDVEIASSP